MAKKVWNSITHILSCVLTSNIIPLSHFSNFPLYTLYLTLVSGYSLILRLTNSGDKKKSFHEILIFSDLIYVCVNKKKWLQPSITYFEHVQILCTGMVLFPLVSGYSLILRWKNLGDQKKCPDEADSFFLPWYIWHTAK